MTEYTHVYWKKIPGAEGNEISGWCPHDQIPSNGEVKRKPLPTEPEKVVTEGSNDVTYYFPPIVGSRYAYRYVVRVTDYWREKILNVDEDTLERHLLWNGPETVQRADSQRVNTDVENWWWYTEDNFRSLPYNTKTPLSLMKKWKHKVLELILDGHPLKEKALAEWNDKVDAHKSYVKRRNSEKAAVAKKQVGDLVIKPYHQCFSEGVCRQIYRYRVASDIKTRTQYGLYVNNSRHTIPHGDAVPLQNIDLSSKSYSCPIRTAACVLLWEAAPKNTGHEIVAADFQYRSILVDLCNEFDLYLERALSPLRSLNEAHHWKGEIEACSEALKAFGDCKNTSTQDPVKHNTSQMEAYDFEKMLHIKTASALENLNSFIEKSQVKETSEA